MDIHAARERERDRERGRESVFPPAAKRAGRFPAERRSKSLNEGGVFKIYDEAESSHLGAMFKMYDDPKSLHEGGVFKIYNKTPHLPHLRACLRCMMIRNRQMRGAC